MSENRIHGTAVVENGVELGVGVEVGPFSYIAEGAKIGDGCVIGPHVTIYGNLTMGADCEVHAGAVLADTPQDTGFSGDESGVMIGDRCKIREGVTIHRGSKRGAVTSVGNECFIMGFCHLAHDVKLDDGVIMVNGSLMGGYVEVGEKAFISGNVSVHQFVRIGRLAMVGGGCMLSKDVPPFCTVRGASLNGVSGTNVVGMKRAGFGALERKEVKNAYRLLYREGLSVSQAREQLRESGSEMGLELCRFIESSKRGICVE